MEKLKIIVDNNGRIQIYMDGYALTGVRAIDFCWEVGEVPYHKIEFVTQATKFDRKYSMD